MQRCEEGTRVQDEYGNKGTVSAAYATLAWVEFDNGSGRTVSFADLSPEDAVIAGKLLLAVESIHEWGEAAENRVSANHILGAIEQELFVSGKDAIAEALAWYLKPHDNEA